MELGTTDPMTGDKKTFFLHTRPGMGVEDDSRVWRQHDDFDVLTSFMTFWRYFHVSFRQTFRRQRIREEPYRTFLDRKMKLF